MGLTAARQAGRHRRRLVLMVLAGALLAALGAVAPTSANAVSTTPVRIVIDQVFSDITAPDGTASAAPYVLVRAGETFHVQVSFYDATGAPAAFSSDTTLKISSLQGTLTPGTGTAPKGATTATINTSMSTAANQVRVTVATAGKSPRVTPGTSTDAQLFDVLKALQFATTSANVGFQGGIGGDDSNCSSPTKANPVCGFLSLPHGAQSSQTLLSLGACDKTYAACGSTNGSVVQTLTDLTGLYTKTDPATLIVKCDKTLCGTGAIHDQHLNYSLGGNDPLTRAPDCPAKLTIGADQTACVDYVQSKRDGAGDTYLYMLFDHDMRGSVG